MESFIDDVIFTIYDNELINGQDDIQEFIGIFLTKLNINNYSSIDITNTSDEEETDEEANTSDEDFICDSDETSESDEEQICEYCKK